MKKSLLALAVAAAIPAVAQAQSSVTLYGIADASIEYSNKKATGGDATLGLANGTGSGSRLGVRGTEKLGNSGMNAIFAIEHRWNVDNGAQSDAAKFWNGFAYVGLTGGFGQISAGRQYSPIFWAVLPADFAGYGFYNNWLAFKGVGAAGISQPAFRMDNSVYYKSPSIGGLTVHAAYAFGEVSTVGAKSNDIYSIAAGWQIGKVYVGGGYQKHSDTTTKDLMSAVVSYNPGNFGVSLGYQKFELVSGAEVAYVQGSGHVKMGANQLIVNLTQIDPTGVAAPNSAELQWGVTLRHDLSNRTDLYVSVGLNDASGWGGASGQTRAAVGLRHKF